MLEINSSEKSSMVSDNLVNYYRTNRKSSEKNSEKRRINSEKKSTKNRLNTKNRLKSHKISSEKYPSAIESSENYTKLKHSSEKSSEKILKIIKTDPIVTIELLSIKLNITTRAVEKNLSKLKSTGLIERIGPDKGGYWKVIP
jgi:ATP-dependent DNA helicase RecG